MQKLTTLLQRFTKHPKGTTSAPPSTLSKTDTPFCKWYQSIDELPLKNFQDVVIDQNYSALIISGFPSQPELQLAWQDILGEYTDMVADYEHKLYISSLKEVHTLQVTLQQIHLLVECLQEVYYQPFVDKLNGLLFTSYKLDPSNAEEYHKTLNSAIMRSKGIKIDLDLKLIQMKAIEEKAKDGEQYTRRYFQAVLITLSDHANHTINDSITVFEYCTRLQRFTEYVKAKEKQYGRK